MGRAGCAKGQVALGEKSNSAWMNSCAGNQYNAAAVHQPVCHFLTTRGGCKALSGNILAQGVTGKPFSDKITDLLASPEFPGTRFATV